VSDFQKINDTMLKKTSDFMEMISDKITQNKNIENNPRKQITITMNRLFMDIFFLNMMLKINNIKIMQTNEDDQFDPALHEPVNTLQKNTYVNQVIYPGIKHNSRIIARAIVKLNKNIAELEQKQINEK